MARCKLPLPKHPSARFNGLPSDERNEVFQTQARSDNVAGATAAQVDLSPCLRSVLH